MIPRPIVVRRRTRPWNISIQEVEVSFSNATSTLISRHSCCTLESDVGRCLNFARTERVSESRPLEANQRGEYGNKLVPTARRKAGTSWRKRGIRNDQSELIVRVP
jgi:hypothetical protein